MVNNRLSPAGIPDVRKGIESDFAGSGYESSFQYFATRRDLGEVATFIGTYVTIRRADFSTKPSTGSVVVFQTTNFHVHIILLVINPSGTTVSTIQ